MKAITRFFQGPRTNILAATVVAIAVIFAGYLVLRTGAAGFFAASELESGSVTGNAQIVSDATASNGKAVKFLAGGSTTPPPTTPPPTTPPPTTPPPATGSCVGNAHTPGGSDGMGSCWPGAHNTGYPKGLPGDTRKAVTLTTYSGCTISASTTLDGRTFNCNADGLSISGGASVVIRNSKINGGVRLDTRNGGHVTIEDSEIVGGPDSNFHGVMWGRFTLTRVNVHGGAHNVLCEEGPCKITDSWLHTPKADGESHDNALFVGQGTNDVIVTHSVLACDIPETPQGGGCSANSQLNGDVSITMIKNLFIATPASANGFYYCLQAHTKAGVFRDNIFQRGASGRCGRGDSTASWAVTGFVASSSNVWQNNKWDDGTLVTPR